ncbi:MAG TPA: PKD domain-containing protein [Solirubrobacteraceae bacterium]|nr:PKD domain-containing protein [Solirubrobacteraceae bacterium]
MTTAAATIALFALPAAAQAATYTVKAGNGPCGAPADLDCGSLTEAAIAAGNGDTFNISPGTYDAAEFTDSGLSLVGAPGVAINGTMTFSGNAGAPNKLSKVAISQPVGNAPGINVSGATGLQISDSAVVSVNGNAIIIAGGAANQIIRTLVVTAGQETAAVLVESTAGTAAKGLTLESSLLTGGGAGLRAVTTNTALQAGAGDITIVARHLTAAGSTFGIHLDASNAASLAGAVGNIRATLSDSIALNNKTQRYAVIGGANEASITADSRTLQTGDQAVLFADPGHKNFRLRPDSPAIDKGGFTAGESTTDIDGDPRPGPTTDLGADEFVNAAPIARIVVKTAKPRAGQPVLLDGTGSSDREGLAGGGIVQYRWDFGDGTTENTTTPSVLHTYGGEGAAAAQLVVVDRQGLASTPAIARVDVGDGTPPVVTITKPFAGQKIKLTTKKTKNVTTNGVTKKVTTTTKTKLKFTGAAKDKSGVGFVLLTIEKLSSTAPATSAQASQTTSTKAQCTWFDAKKGLLKTSCVKPKLIVAKLLSDGSWTYTVSSKVKRPSAGLYRISAYGADGSGAFGNSAPSKDSVIRFRLAK